jgi:hypothetical protein
MATYKTQVRVTREMLKDTPMNDEYIQRQMVFKLLKNMPLEALSKLFKFEKFDPFSDESQNVLDDRLSPDWHKERIIHFREMKQLEYEASVTIG